MSIRLYLPKCRNSLSATGTIIGTTTRTPLRYRGHLGLAQPHSGLDRHNGNCTSAIHVCTNATARIYPSMRENGGSAPVECPMNGRPCTPSSGRADPGPHRDSSEQNVRWGQEDRERKTHYAGPPRETVEALSYRRGWPLPPSPSGTAGEASASRFRAKAAPETAPASAAEWRDQEDQTGFARTDTRLTGLSMAKLNEIAFPRPSGGDGARQTRDLIRGISPRSPQAAGVPEARDRQSPQVRSGWTGRDDRSVPPCKRMSTYE